MKREPWQIEVDEQTQGIRRIASLEDPEGMNWVRPDRLWGVAEAPEGLKCQVERGFTDRGTLRERFVFTNATEFDMCIPEGDLAISVPLPDNYPDANTCQRLRCHAHIWCGGEQSYVMALRMNGRGPHLGLVLTQGALAGYTIDRDAAVLSNDRGRISLHLPEMWLLPGEETALEWELFWHEGREDFERRVAAYPNFVSIQADQYIWFRGEPGALVVEGQKMPVHTSRCGAQRLEIQAKGRTTYADVAVIPPAMELLERRCQFIVAHQQCQKKGSALDGAYLIYDNQTGRLYYSHENDHNGGRERMGMGALIALYLQHREDAALRASLDRYLEFIHREIFDRETGLVYNDVGHCMNINRIYNYPWACILFMEMYNLTGRKEELEFACSALRAYYSGGGRDAYPIGIPMTELCARLQQAGMAERFQEMRTLFLDHGDRLLEIGVNYPPMEVNYEQSIVAPAVDYLLMAYELSGEARYLEGAREQLKLLELFNGDQPDYHLNQTAIRHWDGYWFGKRRMLGDTFPHYWSCLSGNVFARYGRITGDQAYTARAERSLRGPLTMIFEDGSASCAMLYPTRCSGVPARFFDPWANDQDWGLYYYVKHMNPKWL